MEPLELSSRDVARLLTLVEEQRHDEAKRRLADLRVGRGHAHIVGVTGSPGVGKSTLVSQLIEHWTSNDRRVAVVAVDPSSTLSNGALLGDRVRMLQQHTKNGVFVRSMATRGRLGGLSAATPMAVMILDAVGFDIVLVETVGIGQSEIAVATMADTAVVVTAPETGDSVQALKAGVMEIADIFCINKADRGGAGRTESQLRRMLDAAPGGWSGVWRPPVVRTSALRGEGIDRLVEAMAKHHAHLEASGEGKKRQRGRVAGMLRDLAVEDLSQQLEQEDAIRGSELQTLVDDVLTGRLNPLVAAERLLSQ